MYLSSALAVLMPEALTAQDATIITEDVQQSLTALAAQYDDLNSTITDLCRDVKKLVHMLAEQYEQDDVYEPLHLKAALEWNLDKHGRRYALLFTPNSLTGIVFSMLGVTGTMTLAAGWSLLNEPDRTIYTPPAGMDQLCVLKYTNFFSGSAA
jgi:hypothetical protein